MTPDPRPKQRKYVQIADALRAAIESGEYRAGDRLPGENALAQNFGVAPLTARQALGVLRGEGLVESRKGSGVFVQSFRPIRRRGIPRLSRDQWGTGQTIWSADDDRAPAVDQVVVEEGTVPPDHIRRVLDLGDDATVCVRGRRYVMDERPVMLATSYLPQELVTGSAITQAETGPGGIYARLADLGHAPVRFREEIRSRMPSGEEAARLAIPADRSVLKLVRTAFDAEGRAVEVNEMTLDAAAYVLDYEFDAH